MTLLFLFPSSSLLPLGTSAATSTGTLALRAPTTVALGASAAISSATLGLNAPSLSHGSGSGAVGGSYLGQVSLGEEVWASTGIARLQLAPMEPPDPGTQTLRVRARAAAGAGLLRVTLFDSDGTTVRGTTDFTLTGSFQTFELEPSGITDYSALQVAFEGRAHDTVTVEVSWVEFMVPVASAGGQLALDPAHATADATLALTAKTLVPLAAAAAVSTTAIAFTVPTFTPLPLGVSAAQFNADFHLTAETLVVLNASVAESTTALLVTLYTPLELDPCEAVSDATLFVTQPVFAAPRSDLPTGATLETRRTELVLSG